MKSNPLRSLESFGQSIWTDFISRGMIESGELLRLVNNDGVGGVTSNPSIFEKAIAESHDYDSAIREMADQGKSAEEIYQALTVEDIQRTADILRPTYDRLHSADGFVSLEVSPKLANNTDATIAEARILWKAVNRPNVMIKVPGTEAGIPAIRELLREGINVNITLLFGLPRYRQVIEAYIGAMESRATRKEQLQNVSSVASFFLSRIDVLLDPILEKKSQAPGKESGTAKSLIGEVAIASAKAAYRIYSEAFDDKRFSKLARLGARTQRLLWASTSTKNPKYSDVKYVEPLIGAETINTVPLETLNAYRDHGNPRSTLTDNPEGAQATLNQLKQIGIDLDAVTLQLEKEGVDKFVKAYDVLMGKLKEKMSEPVPKGAA
ncbi:MAG TPA: transaldolase [Bacteroidota bacterium]